MSRTAIIADIHGNYAGLIAALADIEERKCDRILCLGDIVNGGTENAQVIREIQSRGIVAIRGNHDEYHDSALAADVEAYLQALPEEIVEDGVLFTHISPLARQRKVNTPFEAWNVFDETSWRIVFVGHVHYSLVYGQQCDSPASATEYPVVYNEAFALQPDDRYVVSVGPIGYSRDGVDAPRYAIFDRDANTIEIRLVEGALLDLGG